MKRISMIIFLIINLVINVFAQKSKTKLVLMDKLTFSGKLVNIEEDSFELKARSLENNLKIPIKNIESFRLQRTKDYRWFTVPILTLVGMIPGIYYLSKEDNTEGPNFGNIVYGIPLFTIGTTAGAIMGFYVGRPSIINLNLNGDKGKLLAQKKLLNEFMKK